MRRDQVLVETQPHHARLVSRSSQTRTAAARLATRSKRKPARDAPSAPPPETLVDARSTSPNAQHCNHSALAALTSFRRN
eukprot:2845599-Prymnesium_polylepis.2